MAQEFTINSSAIETKINQLLPSQGGFGAGVDFSASTMVIPIVDLTETAEGSDVRADLQTSLSHNSITPFSVANATNTVLIATTGYYRIFGNVRLENNAIASFNLFDGSTSKRVVSYRDLTGATLNENVTFDFNVFLSAGDSFRATSSSALGILEGCTRQIADISGNLVNPL